MQYWRYSLSTLEMASQLFVDFNGRQRQTRVNMEWLVIDEWALVS